MQSLLMMIFLGPQARGEGRWGEVWVGCRSIIGLKFN